MRRGLTDQLQKLKSPSVQVLHSSGFQQRGVGFGNCRELCRGWTTRFPPWLAQVEANLETRKHPHPKTSFLLSTMACPSGSEFGFTTSKSSRATPVVHRDTTSSAGCFVTSEATFGNHATTVREHARHCGCVSRGEASSRRSTPKFASTRASHGGKQE